MHTCRSTSAQVPGTRRYPSTTWVYDYLPAIRLTQTSFFCILPRPLELSVENSSHYQQLDIAKCNWSAANMENVRLQVPLVPSS